MKKNILLFSFIFFINVSCFGQIKIDNPQSMITKYDLLWCKRVLEKFHPNPYGSLGELGIDSLANEYAKELPSHPIRESEKILIMKSFLEKIYKEDPHVSFIPYVVGHKGKKRIKLKDISVLPFKGLEINDTLLVTTSAIDKIKTGDRILSINGIRINEFLIAGSNNDRYVDMSMLQGFYHFFFYPKYTVEIQRRNEIITVSVNGISLDSKAYIALSESEKIIFFDKEKTAYFKISEFEYNQYLFKRIEKFLHAVKDKGYNNVIFDVRTNPGGSGDCFDYLFSLLTNKKEIPYMEGGKIKISKATYKDYGFDLKDSGKVVSLPPEEIFKSVPLDTTKYIEGIKYYVLVSNYTMSMAASFANMMQYNNIGTLMGECLKPNSTLYGEVAYIKNINGANEEMCVSTCEVNEYTKAKDGIICPDVDIPYIAIEYMQGGDPVLEKCLKYIQENN